MTRKKLLCLIWLNFYSISIVIAIPSPDNSKINDLAYEEMKKGAYTEAYKLSIRAETLAKENNNAIELARAYSNQAANLSYLGENARAIELYKKSEALAVKNNDAYGVLRAINNLSNIYGAIEKHSERLAHRLKQYKLSVEIADEREILISNIGLINIYVTLENEAEAARIIELVRKQFKTFKEDFLEIYFLFAQSSYWEAFGDTKKAMQPLVTALEKSETHAYEGLVAAIKANMADLFLTRKDYSSAVEMAQQSLAISKKLTHKTKQLQSFNTLARVYKAKKDYKKSLDYFERFQFLSDSISGEKVQMLAEVASIDRNVEETKLKLLESQNDQKILTLQLQKQKNNQLIWLISLTSIFFLLLFFYYRFSSKKEITRQKQLNEQLKELDYVKDRVLTNTSHELRTPLNGIIGLSEILICDEESELSETTLDSIRLIKKSGEQLALVVNDILEMSKLKTSKVTVINSEFELFELISDVIKVCLPLAQQKGIEIVYDSEASMHVKQDRTRLQQILFNLIGNAVKFTLKGKIEVSAVAENNRLIIVVKDSGIGVPPDRQERIFEGFEQVDISDSRTEAGTGLGLAISRGLSEALGGELTLKSELGKGSEFILTIPC